MERFLSNEYRILSFDPGSRKLGMSVQVLNLDTFNSLVIHAETLKVDGRLPLKSEWFLTDGEFTARLNVIENYVYNACKSWGPAAVVVELPYMGKRPQAFGALKEVVLTIRKGCRRWSDTRPPFFYEPSVIKKVMGVPGNSGDKGLMLKSLQDNPKIQLAEDVNLAKLDEHAVDAILIGRTHVCIGIQRKEETHGKTKAKKSKNKQRV